MVKNIRVYDEYYEAVTPDGQIVRISKNDVPEKNLSKIDEIADGYKAVANVASKVVDEAKAIGVKSKELLDRISGKITGAVADGKKLTAPTKPKGGVPDGVLKESTERGIIKENESAQILANEGYDIKLLDEVDGGNGYGIPGYPSNPDYLIDGIAFDCYAPMPTSSFKTITKKLYDKTKQQSSRIILNLDDFPKESLDDLVSTILNKTSEAGDLKRLEELKIIIDGKIADIFLR